MSAALAVGRVPRILLADDHPTILKTVTGMLAPYFDVVAAVSDGKAALDAVAQTNPDVVLSDIAMPRFDGFQTARELKEKESRAKVVFLTGQEEDDYIAEALNIGARGYVVKRRLQTDLVQAVNIVLAGKYFVSPHAFTETPNDARKRHALKFFGDENTFFREASELTYFALARGERVFMFLSKMGLHFVREQLGAMGLDYIKAIKCGQIQASSVENIVPSLMQGNRPSPELFEAFFGPCWERAGEQGFRLTIISYMIATLLRQGYGYEIATQVEEVWNNIIPRHFCTVYCGCPVTHLDSKESRETLSRICAEHSKVIPIDQFKGHVDFWHGAAQSLPNFRNEPVISSL